MEPITQEQPRRRKRALAFLLTFLCFLLFGAICFFAGSVLIRQGQEVKISVDTSGEEFTESVTFTVSNVLGIDILVDEGKESCAMLQFNQDGEWVDVCEIRFVQEDNAVLSVKYGGMYAHLAPGMELRYCLDQEILNSMTSGEYRIAVSYISEAEYLEYLQERAEEIDESLEEALENGALSVSEVSAELSQEEDMEEEQPDEEDAPKPEVQIFYKEFVFVSQQDISNYYSQEQKGYTHEKDV